MARFRRNAYAKVNLCLFLGPTRSSDARHELVTVFQSLSLADRLDVWIGAERDEVICPGVDGENLAWRALAGLRARGWRAPPVRIEIDKRIPVAAGMAGGSTDAAAVVMLAHGRLEWADIFDLAAELGADVPAALDPGLSLGLGAGEQIYRYRALAEHAYVVLPSREQLSTPAVFREADRLGLPRGDLAECEQRVRAALRPGARLPAELIVNDLQPAALSLCPSIADALEAVSAAGAEHALVSGSGPTVVGLRWGPDAEAWAQETAASLEPRFPGALAAQPLTTP